MTENKPPVGQWLPGQVALSGDDKTPIAGTVQQMPWMMRPMQRTLVLEMMGNPRWRNCPPGVTSVILMDMDGNLIFAQKFPYRPRPGDTIHFGGPPAKERRR